MYVSECVCFVYYVVINIVFIICKKKTRLDFCESCHLSFMLLSEAASVCWLYDWRSTKLLNLRKS